MATSSSERPVGRSPGWAWIALYAGLALHVADEAANDFLSLYNPAVRAIRDRAPFLPLPTFDFRTWISGLLVLLAVLVALTPLAFRAARGLRPFALVFGALMILNGLAHLGISALVGRAIAGTYSAPFLLAAAVWLVAVAWRHW